MDSRLSARVSAQSHRVMSLSDAVLRARDLALTSTGEVLSSRVRSGGRLWGNLVSVSSPDS